MCIIIIPILLVSCQSVYWKNDSDTLCYTLLFACWNGGDGEIPTMLLLFVVVVVDDDLKVSWMGSDYQVFRKLLLLLKRSFKTVGYLLLNLSERKWLSSQLCYASLFAHHEIMLPLPTLSFLYAFTFITLCKLSPQKFILFFFLAWAIMTFRLSLFFSFSVGCIKIYIRLWIWIVCLLALAYIGVHCWLLLLGIESKDVLLFVDICGEFNVITKSFTTFFNISSLMIPLLLLLTKPLKKNQVQTGNLCTVSCYISL